MKKHIKLTAFVDDNCLQDKDIYLFTRHIVRFEKAKVGNAQAQIFLITGDTILVKESPAEIKKSLS